MKFADILIALFCCTFSLFSEAKLRPTTPASLIEDSELILEKKTGISASEHAASEVQGAICIGPDHSKARSTEEIFVKVDGAEKKSYSKSEGLILFKDLDLDKIHTVHLLVGNKSFLTLAVDFKKLKTNFVILWKAAGAWKLLPVGGTKCEWPMPSCPKGHGC